VQALASYARVAGGDSLSKLAIKIRARGMQQFVEDIKPSAEFDRRRKTHLSSEKEPITRRVAGAGKKQLGAVVESSLPIPVDKLATRNMPRPAKCQTPSLNVDEVLASRSGLRQKLDGIAEILKDEGKKQFGTIDPRTIGRLAHHLQRLAEEWNNRSDWPNELGETNLSLEADLKKLHERIARLEHDLRVERAIRSTAIHQLRSEMSDSSHQWQWVSRISAGSALFVALAVGGFFGRSWWDALMR
jgi:hypothetical protein